MPKALYTNDGIKETVTRPVVFDITRQIQEWTGVRAMSILFTGDTEVALNPGSTIDDEPGFNNTASRELWRVHVREDYQTDRLLSTAVHQMEYPEFFYDPKIDLYLRGVYSPTVLTLEFEYRSSDQTNARRWRDEIRARVSTNRDVRTHVVNYSFLIPKEYDDLLAHMHELRESQAGYGEDLETYLTNHFTQNVTKLTNMGQQQGNERWAVAEQQGRIMGQFEFQDVPEEPSKTGEASAWRQVFSYRIFFDCPIATAADYPVLVHNQLIDERFMMYQPKDDLQTFESKSSRSGLALGAFEVNQMAQPTIPSGLRIPAFHEFYPATVPRYTLQVLSALIGIEVDPDTGKPKRTIMNFNEIDENWEFRKEFLDHMRFDHKNLNKYGESFVHVTVYDNHMPLHDSNFYVDENLNVILNGDPDLRRTYYVRLSLLMDPSQLSPGAKDRARDNAEGTILIGVAICPDLVKYKKLPPTLGNSNYISRVEAEKFFTRIRQCTSTVNTGHLSDKTTIQWNTVMILYIEAYNKDRENKE